MLELWNDDLQAQLQLATSELDRSKALAEEARLRAEIAEREAKRQTELQQQGMASEERVDRTVMEAEAARAEQLAAQADSKVREHQCRLIAAQIDRGILRAPFTGIVAEVNGEVGEYVTPSPVGISLPAAVDLIDDSSLYVSAPIDEVDASHVRNGMTARVTMDAFGKKAFDGRVRRIAPYVLDREKQARTVDVEVDFDPGTMAEVLLLAGYSADVEVLLAQRTDVVRVPTEAVGEGSVVLVVGPANAIERRAVRTGLSNWRHTEVLEGLQPGERIVLSTDRAGLDAGVVVTEGKEP
jgi:HlyD family secretion protein